MANDDEQHRRALRWRTVSSYGQEVRWQFAIPRAAYWHVGDIQQSMRAMQASRAQYLATFVALLSVLAACSHAGVSRQELAGWEARYVPAPSCRLAVARGPVTMSTNAAARTGTLVVRLTAFGKPETLGYGQLELAPLLPLDTTVHQISRFESTTERPSLFVAALLPGRYVSIAHAFGYEGRTDTLAARAGATDTVTIALEEYQASQRNSHNCRPRGFRHPGERACVTDQIARVLVLDRARDMASPRFRFGIGLPAGDSTGVSVVDDERVCERAARVYGFDASPPRRVVVVEAGNMYVVYDPSEPVVLGEGNQWLIVDKRMRVLARMSL
jgi:hypothetical protein